MNETIDGRGAEHDGATGPGSAPPPPPRDDSDAADRRLALAARGRWLRSLPWWRRWPEELGDACFGLPLLLRDTALVVLFAVLADNCLYVAPGGAGAACVFFAAVCGLILAKRQGVRWQAALPLGIAMLMAVMSLWRHWWLLEVVGWGAVFVGAVRLHHPEWEMVASLCASLETLFVVPARFAGHILMLRSKATHRGTDEQKDCESRFEAKVVVVPVVVCLLFVLIFAAANPVVGQLLEGFGDWFGGWWESLWKHISVGRVIVWLLWAALFAALIRPALSSSFAQTFVGRNHVLDREVTGDGERGNAAMALSTLLSVNALFLVYNVMDANYLYREAALPAGITWTDYTHAGCGWLTLALFVSTVVIGITFRGGLNFSKGSARIKQLAYLWSVQNAILGIGSLRRLQMYIDYSGLTHLRITGIYGSLLIVVGLAVMVVKVRRNHSFTWLVQRYVAAFCLGLAVLALTPNDWVCTRYNVARVLEGKRRALRPICLKQLSSEAVPPLLALLKYDHPERSERSKRVLREGVAGILGQHLNRLSRKRGAAWSCWQASDVWALKHLDAVQDDILAACPRERWNEARARLVENCDI